MLKTVPVLISTVLSFLSYSVRETYLSVYLGKCSLRYSLSFLCVHFYNTVNVVLIFLAVAGGGHDEHFVGVNHAGHVGLGAPDVNALVVLLHYVDEQVGVGLLRGA